MSMMVNRVSNLSFRASSSPENSDDFLKRSGAYSKPIQDASAQKPKNKHSALKFITGTVIAAAVVAGGLLAAHKFKPEIFNAALKFEDIGNIEKATEKYTKYITTAIGKGGKWLDEKAYNPIATRCSNLWAKYISKTA